MYDKNTSGHRVYLLAHKRHIHTLKVNSFLKLSQFHHFCVQNGANNISYRVVRKIQ